MARHLLGVAFVFAVITSVPTLASAQCLPPGTPTGLTWVERASGIQLTWVPNLGTATSWTVVMTPVGGGTALTFVLNDSRSWGIVSVAPGAYDVTVRGTNACGSGATSEPARINTAGPPAVTGIVINEIGPFIEIVNTGSTRVNLGGWRLYGSSGADQRVIFGARIDDLTDVNPGCSLLIGDTEREDGVPVDFRIPLQFGFSTTLALASLDNHIVDEVGRDPSGEANYPGPFGEGMLLAPLTQVPISDTRSYSRVGPDSNDNRRDFGITSPPTPRNSGVCRAIPVSPYNLTAQVQFTSVLLSWQFMDGGVPIDGFQIEAGSLPGRADRAVVVVGPQLRSIQFDGVPLGTYYVRIRSFVGAQGSGASNEVTVLVCGAATCGTLPGAPRNFVRRNFGSDVLLTWEAPAVGGAPTSYVLEVGSSQGASNLGVFDLGSTSLTLFVPNVPPGTYWTRMRAVNAAGIGPPSNELIVVVP